jgi:hypothetical protein
MEQVVCPIYILLHSKGIPVYAWCLKALVIFDMMEKPGDFLGWLASHLDIMF